MPLAISAHEARLNASRTQDADTAYEAVTTALNHAFSHVRVATENGHTRTMFTLLPDYHGIKPIHGAQAAREVASALKRKGFRVTPVSPLDMLIVWGDTQNRSKRGRAAPVAPEDLWRFESRG